MSLRVYVGPPDEVSPSVFRPWAARVTLAWIALWWPTLPNGRPASNWVITICRATDWTAADNDPALTNLFAPELDGTEETPAQLIAALKSHTLSQVGTTRANAIKARLDTLGVPYSDFTGATTMFELFKRVLACLHERDFTFGDNWSV